MKPKFIYKWYKKTNEILEINNFNEENIQQIKKLGDQISKKFNKVKQLIKDLKIKDHDILK